MGVGEKVRAEALEDVRALRELFRVDVGEAVRRRVMRCCGDLERAALVDMVPELEGVMAGRVMPDAFDMMAIATAVGCRVGDLVRDVGGAG